MDNRLAGCRWPLLGRDHHRRSSSAVRRPTGPPPRVRSLVSAHGLGRGPRPVRPPLALAAGLPLREFRPLLAQLKSVGERPRSGWSGCHCIRQRGGRSAGAITGVIVPPRARRPARPCSWRCRRRWRLLVLAPRFSHHHRLLPESFAQTSGFRGLPNGQAATAACAWSVRISSTPLVLEPETLVGHEFSVPERSGGGSRRWTMAWSWSRRSRFDGDDWEGRSDDDATTRSCRPGCKPAQPVRQRLEWRGGGWAPHNRVLTPPRPGQRRYPPSRGARPTAPRFDKRRASHALGPLPRAAKVRVGPGAPASVDPEGRQFSLRPPRPRYHAAG